MPVFAVGQEYLPTIFEPKRVDQIMDIPQIEAEKTARRLAREEGISAGTSSGGGMGFSKNCRRKSGCCDCLHYL